MTQNNSYYYYFLNLRQQNLYLQTWWNMIILHNVQFLKISILFACVMRCNLWSGSHRTRFKFQNKFNLLRRLSRPFPFLAYCRLYSLMWRSWCAIALVASRRQKRTGNFNETSGGRFVCMGCVSLGFTDVLPRTRAVCRAAHRADINVNV